MVDQTTEETIFAQEPTQTPPVTEPVQNQEPVIVKEDYADLLSSITTTEGRQKYSDVKAALESLPHANKHISDLEVEMATLKEDLTKRQTAEEIMSRLDTQVQPVVETPSTQPVDLAQLEALVDKRLSSVEQQKVSQANVAQVTSKMSEMYGEKAEEMFYTAGKEAGLSAIELNTLAAKSPKAVLKILGVGAKAPAIPAKSSGTLNTEALAMNQQPVTSAKVPNGATTKDMVNAWRNAGTTTQ